jgi:hypothetical protein
MQLKFKELARRRETAHKPAAVTRAGLWSEADAGTGGEYGRYTPLTLT